jgi:hypothetical protein
MIALHVSAVDLTLLPSDALNGESIDSRNKVMDILLPLTFAWFRVRPFRSLSPLPLFQPITSHPPPSTHSYSKVLTHMSSSTEVALHHAY